MGEVSESTPTPSIQIDFPLILRGVTNFDGISDAIANELRRLKVENGIKRIGFVSGGLANSEDPEEAKRQREINSELMRQDVAMLRVREGIPVFASTDIFDVVWKQLEETQPDQISELPDKMMVLFQNLLINGGITDIYMRPGWDDFKGSSDEYNTAEMYPDRITIHYL